MTTTIPSTLNASSSASPAPAASKEAKTAYNTPGTPVSAHQGNGQRTTEKRHHGDPAWAAAFQAAIGRQPNGAAGPTPAASHSVSKGTSKEPANGVTTVSAGQGAAKQVSSALRRGAEEALSPGNSHQVSKPEPRRGDQVAKNFASHGRSGVENTTAQSQKSAPIQQARQTDTPLPPEGGQKPPSADSKVADARNAHGTAGRAKEKAPTLEIGHSESAQSNLVPTGLRPATANPVIAQARHTDEQPGLSAQNPIQVQGRHSATKPVPVSNLQEGVGIQPTTIPVSSHTAPVAPSLHVSAAAPAQSAQMLNPVSLQQLNAQIHILHQAGGGHAEIRLDPPSLGSVQIQLNLQQNQAQVSFHASQSATAQMLQVSLPQLTQAMQQQGITLTHTQVHASSDGAGVGPNMGGHGQQPGQQSGQQLPENGRARVSFDGPGNAPAARDSESGVRAYA